MKNTTLEDLGYNTRLDQYRRDENLEEFNKDRVISEHKDKYVMKAYNGEFDSELIGSLWFTAESRNDLPAVGDWITISE